MTVAYYDVDLLSAVDYYPFGMQMPGRVFNGGGYRFGFNGHEKSDEIKGVGNSYTAQFWEYDPRLGRRWNLDPMPQVTLSDYSTLGNNPVNNVDIKNVDIKGDYFWGLFGSTSSQRQSAGEFAERTGGEVKNIWKRSIYVRYQKSFTGSDGVVNVWSGSQYFNKNGSLVNPAGEVNEWKPNALYNWGQSKNFFAAISYSFADDFYVTAQNLFIKNTFGDGNAYHLGGGSTTVSENISAFVTAGTSLVPIGGLEAVGANTAKATSTVVKAEVTATKAGATAAKGGATSKRSTW